MLARMTEPHLSWKLIGSPSMVGFVEPSDFDPATPSSLNPECLRQVGPFKVCWDAKPFGYSINRLVEGLVRDASEPETN